MTREFPRAEPPVRRGHRVSLARLPNSPETRPKKGAGNENGAAETPRSFGNEIQCHVSRRITFALDCIEILFYCVFF